MEFFELVETGISQEKLKLMRQYVRTKNLNSLV